MLTYSQPLPTTDTLHALYDCGLLFVPHINIAVINVSFIVAVKRNIAENSRIKIIIYACL